MNDLGRLACLIAFAIVFAVSLMCFAMFLAAPKPRHHIYYCMAPSGFALPCMYRTNTPVEV